MKKIISRIARIMSVTALSLATCMSCLFVPVVAESNAGTMYQDEDGNYYYEPLEQGVHSNGGYTVTKVSHSTNGAGILDGIIDDDTASGQSYSWSMEESGDYVYIGTCYNSTYYIYYNKISSSLKEWQEKGTISSEVDVINTTKEILRVMFGTDSFDSEVFNPMSWDPVIIAVNKKTGEAKVIFRESEVRSQYPEMFIGGVNALSGYRMAIKYKGKIYFAGMGSPTATLVEVDPTTNKAQIVYYNKNITSASTKDYGSVSCGVHGLLVYDDEILMCLATDDLSKFDKSLKAEPGAIIVASSDPSASLTSWKPIATSKSFDDLPAVMQIDGLNGGGIWDIIEYNGKLYVTVVTDKTDKETGVTNKQGFALYSGTKQEDGSFIWEQIAGDHGKLPFGFGISYSMSCNMWTYNGYLYLGTYNDPMIDLMSVATSGDFEDLYNDLDHSIYLYRMDEDGNFEQVGGKDDNPSFPNGSIGNLGAGLGNNSNQYCWRFGVHDGELYIGTYDTSTLTYMFTQLTDGQVSTLSDEEMQGRANELQKALMNVLNVDNELLKQFLSKTVFSKLSQKIFQKLSGGVTGLSKDWNPVPDYLEALEEYESFKDLINEKIDAISLADSNSSNSDLTEVINDVLSDDDELGISIDDYLESLDEEDLIDLYSYAYPEEAIENTSLFDSTNEARFSNIKDKLKEKLKELVSDLFEKTDKIFYDQNLHNFVYYFGTNYYAQSCEKGFDLLVSNDGVNFDAITRNGFGDGTNHGLRTLCSTDSGLFMGTANPFHSTQLWKLTTKDDVEPTPTTEPTTEPTVIPTSEPTSAPTIAPSPTSEPTVSPTVEPTESPTPSVEPTTTPTVEPTSEPTATPTSTPTATPESAVVPSGSNDSSNNGSGSGNATAAVTTNGGNTVARAATNTARNRTRTNTNAATNTTDNTTATSTPEATATPTSTPKATSTPTVINDDETPEVASKGHWAIANLVLGLLSVLIAVMMIAMKSDENDKTALVCKVVAGVSALASVVTFVLTQQIGQSMVFADAWTILMAIYGICSIATICIKKFYLEDSDTSEEE